MCIRLYLQTTTKKAAKKGISGKTNEPRQEVGGVSSQEGVGGSRLSRLYIEHTHTHTHTV